MAWRTGEGCWNPPARRPPSIVRSCHARRSVNELRGPRWKASEARARRQAKAQGLRVTKSRRRNEQALDFGRYWLSTISGNWLVLGDSYGVGLDEVETYLQDDSSGISRGETPAPWYHPTRSRRSEGNVAGGFRPSAARTCA